MNSLKYISVHVLLFFLWSCNTTHETKKEASLPDTTKIEDSIPIKKQKKLTPPVYPAYKVHDRSWSVHLEINEGFFEGYHVYYPDREHIEVLHDESVPVLGGVDYPDPYYIDSITYFIPNVGGSAKGYFQLYIYKDGSCKYNEVILISESLQKDSTNLK